jgi:general stress protein CsbA
MVFWLLISSLIAGPIATLIMVVFQYLPVLWGGGHYDWLGAIGSTVLREMGRRALIVGAIIHFGFGIVFAYLYGMVAWGLLAVHTELPQLLILGGSVNLFDVTIGAVIGLGHGLLVALVLAVVVIEHHPFREYRASFFVIPSAVISHVAFGTMVMFFHSLILRTATGLAY